MKSNEEARQYFIDCGLDYSKIDEPDFWLLETYVAKELANFIFSDHVYDEKGNMRINQKRTRFKFLKKEFKEAYIIVKGPYFAEREGISFNRDGFIGFAGWASSDNVRPFIKAFTNWCDAIKNDK